MRDYHKYEVWKKSHELVLYIYQDVLKLLPGEENYELATQFRRAAYSVPLNIVEGCGRSSDKDFAHFLDMALGSIQEVEYCSLLLKDLDYISEPRYQLLHQKAGEVKAMLIALIKSVRK